MFTRGHPMRLACLLVCAAALESTASAAERTLNRTYSVEAGGRLEVIADSAAIQVTGSSGTQVVVNVVFKGSQAALDDLDLGAEQQGNDVRVTAKRKSRMRNPIEGHITVQVPSRYDLELKTSGGALDIEQITGKVHGKTSGGDVTAKRVQGNLEIQTSGGNVTAEGVQGDLTASTSGGSISIDDVVGTTHAHSSGGSVSARRARGATDLHTSGGDITAEVTSGKIAATTSGGDIRVVLSGINRGISATTSGGTVELQLPRDVQATLDAGSSGGSVRSELATVASQKSQQRLYGTLNGGGETIYARTSGGDVRISER